MYIIMAKKRGEGEREGVLGNEREWFLKSRWRTSNKRGLVWGTGSPHVYCAVEIALQFFISILAIHSNYVPLSSGLCDTYVHA